MYRHLAMVSWGHHGLSWMSWYRVRVTPGGRSAHGRAFGAERETTARAGLGRVGRELEGGRNGSVADIDFDALAGEDGVDVIEVKAWDVPLEERFALDKLALDALGVSAGREGLAMAVFLVAGRACGGTGGAAGVLGVALRGEGGKRREGLGRGPRMLANSGGQTGDLPSVSPDGTCLDLFASATSTGFMRAP